MKFEKPKFKRYVFAQEAEQTTVEDVPDVQTTEKEKEGYCGYQHGFTNVNMTAIEQGGKPPRGTQFNQILKDITGITQYLSAGGLYPMDNEILQSEGYPKNAIICIDGVGLFRSLRDDNKESNYKDTSAWSVVIDFNPARTVQRVVGEIFPAMRTDIPDGCLKCDGKDYQVNQYQYFVDKYLKGNKVAKINIESWNQQYEDNNYNCGYFGYDDNGTKFRTPYIHPGTFLTNNANSGGIGKFGWDTTFKTEDSNSGLCAFNYDFNMWSTERNFNNITGFRTTITNQFKLKSFVAQQDTNYPHQEVNWIYKIGTEPGKVIRVNESYTITFNPTSGLRTSDSILPKHIKYPFFVVISEIFKETTTEK